MDAFDCSLCMEGIEACFLRKTLCCNQSLCVRCNSADVAYKRVPVCPFCRCERYQVIEVEEHGLTADKLLESCEASLLDGIWDVEISGKCKHGKTRHRVVLTIKGNSAKFEDPDGPLDGSGWNELAMGHTKSGKSFSGMQLMSKAPDWLGRGASVERYAGLSGRLEGPHLAKFSTTTICYSSDGEDELEIEHSGEMTRRA